MPPRKAAPSGADAEAPRRSTRISALPKEEVKPAAKAPAKPKATTKRTAEDDGKDGSDAKVAVKKAKVNKTEAEGEETVEKLAPIDIGDSLPSLILKNEKDEDVDVATLTSEKGLVLFLVPKADTPGCTTQACGFRDIYPDFTASNFDVFCLSADTPAAQTKWQTKKELPYPLLSDKKRVLITALGAGDGGKTKRSHFIFEKGGKLVDKKVPVKPADSPKLALEFIKTLSV